MAYLVSRKNDLGLVEYLCGHHTHVCADNPGGYYFAAGDPDFLTNIYRWSRRSDAKSAANPFGAIVEEESFLARWHS
jgi:hypothetical protein